MSFNRILTVFGLIFLVSFNVYLCYTVMAAKNKQRSLVSQNIELAKRSAYMMATYKQALDLDLNSGLKDLKVGVYLNLLACGECNIETIAFIRKKFRISELVFFVDEQLKAGVGQLDLKDAEVKFVNNDHFFLSNSPFFFIQAHGINVMKYTHDNNYPELTVTYIKKIEEYVKSVNRAKVGGKKQNMTGNRLLANTN